MVSTSSADDRSGCYICPVALPCRALRPAPAATPGWRFAGIDHRGGRSRATLPGSWRRLLGRPAAKEGRMPLCFCQLSQRNSRDITKMTQRIVLCVCIMGRVSPKGRGGNRPYRRASDCLTSPPVEHRQRPRRTRDDNGRAFLRSANRPGLHHGHAGLDGIFGTIGQLAATSAHDRTDEQAITCPSPISSRLRIRPLRTVWCSWVADRESSVLTQRRAWDLTARPGTAANNWSRPLSGALDDCKPRHGSPRLGRGQIGRWRHGGRGCLASARRASCLLRFTAFKSFAG